MSDEGIQLLVGKTISKIHEGDEQIIFVCSDGDAFEAYHMQDCCESVVIHDIDGDLQTLVGETITEATEDVSHEWPSDVPAATHDSITWTTHRFTTARGTVTVRWFGESNGYYSETVHFGRTHKPICT
jgi:hypothetical protein